MSIIRIITNKVMQEAVRIDYSAMRVQAAGAVVRLSGLTARTYERNSFGPKVRSICAEADSTAGKLSRGLVGLNIRLSLITGGFIAADIAFLKNLIGTIIGKLPPIDGEGKTNITDATGVKSDSGEILDGIETNATGKPPKSTLNIGLEQDDPRWGNESMGMADHSIKNLGCLITCVAMIGRIQGQDVTPKDINDYLKKNKGYSDGTSYLKWDKATDYLESVTEKPVSYELVSTSNVEKMVKDGNPVIIHVKVNQFNNNNGDGHWVLANGMDGNGNYIVYESGTGKQSTYSPDKLMGGHKAFKIGQ